MYPPATIQLPAWVATEIGSPGRSYATPKARMGLVIRLANRNVDNGGGPFGAAVFESKTGRLVAPGINLVLPLRNSLAHAEAIAIMIAQQVCGTHNLGAVGMPEMELVTSAQPCIQCFGNLWWSGLRRLVIGARKEDVEVLTGFLEGPLPAAWIDHLEHREPLPPVSVRRDLLREEACAVLRRYGQEGGSIYNPG